jgi:hypothetical protein
MNKKSAKMTDNLWNKMVAGLSYASFCITNILGSNHPANMDRQRSKYAKKGG